MNKKIPGVGYFYGGITSKKNHLTMLIAPGLAIAIVSFQVFFFQLILFLIKSE
jgi:ammonia channel protein AmtB